MNRKSEILDQYRIFGSKLRGTPEVEAQIEDILKSKETLDNMNNLASSILVEWRCTEETISNLTLAFSKFEKKIGAQRQDVTINSKSKQFEKLDFDTEYLILRKRAELL